MQGGEFVKIRRADHLEVQGSWRTALEKLGGEDEG